MEPVKQRLGLGRGREGRDPGNVTAESGGAPERLPQGLVTDVPRPLMVKHQAVWEACGPAEVSSRDTQRLMFSQLCACVCA